MPRYFTLAECERLLPQVEQALRSAVLYKSEYQKSDQELGAYQQHIRSSGGARVDRPAFLNLRSRRDTSGAALKDALDQVEQSGGLVKDLDIGLIDFLCPYRGRKCACAGSWGRNGSASGMASTKASAAAKRSTTISFANIAASEVAAN